MKYTENSVLVKVWVKRVKSGAKTREDVPDLYNLQEVVWKVLDERKQRTRKEQ